MCWSFSALGSLKGEALFGNGNVGGALQLKAVCQIDKGFSVNLQIYVITCISTFLSKFKYYIFSSISQFWISFAFFWQIQKAA